MDLMCLKKMVIVTALICLAAHEASGVKCFSCYYQRMLGTESGDSTCRKPDKQTTQTVQCDGECITVKRVGNIGGDTSGGGSKKSKVSDRERYDYVRRGCEKDCRAGTYAYGGYEGENTCCDSNHCNTAVTPVLARAYYLLVPVVTLIPYYWSLV